jgi:hypothetical protein
MQRFLSLPSKKKDPLNNRVKSPLRLRAETRLRRALAADINEGETVPYLSAVSPSSTPHRIHSPLEPAAYCVDKHLPAIQRLESAIEQCSLDHNPPAAISVDPATFVSYLQTIAPNLFFIKRANGQVVRLELGAELPEGLIMCYQSIQKK